ncbi:hypothetical protein [Aureimonas sp. AU40]|uniref:hypothetical protein n=1 Tax=Aureimonas sp. AU40 TaxID=1637747 RepID=UPI00078439B0|nr:hypothetical protein [Aureimonas sp. AU40]
MNAPFNKDAWILDAIACGYISPKRDGTIMRRKSASRDGSNLSAEWALVKQQTHKATGRVYFNMTWKGLTKSVLVNRVIALRFLPNPDNLPQVNHVDGVKAHNYLYQPTPELVAKWGKFQLEWSSGQDNEKHAHRTGLKTGRGTSNANNKLSVEQVLKIRELGPTTPMDDLIAFFGVGRTTIANILRRRTWTHV